jgi:uncharacterized protein with HEPN domain
MWRDGAYLLDILIAARKVLRYAEGFTWETFRADDRTQDAVMRNLQIIGEAARRVSEEFKESHPEISWREILGMRNRLVHEYGRINVERVWETVVDDVPRLVQQLGPLVPSDEE